jgi:hypothetical protein
MIFVMKFEAAAMSRADMPEEYGGTSAFMSTSSRISALIRSPIS